MAAATAIDAQIFRAGRFNEGMLGSDKGLAKQNSYKQKRLRMGN
jgi:hypothetical protein